MARNVDRSSGRLKRFGWFFAIWAASVLALGAVALLFRLFMDLLGLGG